MTNPEICPANCHRPPSREPARYNAYMRGYMARRYEERRARIIKKLGGRCAQCGSTERLEIDHVDRHKKRFDFGKRLAGIAARKIPAEIAKCQLLCRPCHEIKTIEDLEWRLKSKRLVSHKAKLAANRPSPISIRDGDPSVPTEGPGRTPE